MKTTLCTWEDETSNRQVQFSIDYSIENGAVEIETVTPQKVSFICPESSTVQRSVGVHTLAGRRLLADQFRGAAAWDQLAAAVGSPNADVGMPHIAIRMDVLAV